MPNNKSSNPNPRSSEMSNPMRRSFTGNPFAKPSVIANPRTNFPNTPANSPSDFPRRSSVGIRESTESLRDIMDDKENGKDQILKPVKIRSPAASSKGTKNFMSPTISASCKINESPRKKVLVERNEVAPSSADNKSHVRKVTFAEPLEEIKLDGIIPNFEEVSRSSLSSEDLSGESETSVHDVNVPLIPENDTDFLSFETVHDMNVDVPLVLENDIHTESSFETVAKDHDCVNLDPTFKLSPTATPPVSMKATILAPLDADPLMPPYDPKTNYLSPRPQFLHYKPKPRMELCSERELEDSLISGSFSDSEVTEDAQSEVSQKESEDVSSDGTVNEEECQISEPSPARRTVMPEEIVEAKEVPKSGLSVRATAIALILILAVAFVSISVTDSPVLDRTVFEDLYKAYEWSEFSEVARANFDQFSKSAKTNFDGLARNLHIWFTKSLSSISEFISDVRGVHNLAKLQYYNLTVMHDFTEVDQYPIFGPGENGIGDTHSPIWNFQESDVASDISTDEDIEDVSAEHYEVYEEQLKQDIGITSEVENASDAPESEEMTSEVENASDAPESEEITSEVVENASDAPESEEILEGHAATVIESEQALQLAEAGSLEEKKLAQEVDANLNIEKQPSLNSEVAEIVIEEAYGTGNIDIKQAQENNAEFNVNKQSDIALDSEVAEIDTAVNDDDEAKGKSVSMDAAIRKNDQLLESIDIPTHMVLYLLLGAGTVVIAGATFNWSRKGKSSNKIITSSVEQPQNKQISPDKPSLRNGPIERDVLAESCPSEMSSFRQSSSYSKKVAKQLNEAHSIEKKPKNNYRRESLASSDYSTGSAASYGSLTVYEKISSKQGHGDEEKIIITPVRRSSRIRNLATSPS